MPVPIDTTAPPAQHQWHLSFDRKVCRNCGVEHTADDDDVVCKRAERIRPTAGFRKQPTEGRA